jgi:hypothetical protein
MQNCDSTNRYVFNYTWELVVKGFWNKYPCPELDFVKWNKVIDLVVNGDNTLTVKRLVYFNFNKIPRYLPKNSSFFGA